VDLAQPVWKTRAIGGHLLIFIGVAALVIVTPGPDMVLVTKNAVMHGQRAALGTSLGVNAGLAVWTVASALGVASLVRASALAFTILKLLGAAYLIWLGLHALWSARRRWSLDAGDRPDRRRLDARGSGSVRDCSATSQIPRSPSSSRACRRSSFLTRGRCSCRSCSSAGCSC
jgi:threonine/homoserine/homoserine lactone efflux protein